MLDIMSTAKGKTFRETLVRFLKKQQQQKIKIQTFRSRRDTLILQIRKLKSPGTGSLTQGKHFFSCLWEVNRASATLSFSLVRNMKYKKINLSQVTPSKAQIRSFNFKSYITLLHNSYIFISKSYPRIILKRKNKERSD